MHMPHNSHNHDSHPFLTPESLKATLEAALPGAQAQFQDLTGTADHWQVIVVAAAFEGKSLIEQHRIVKHIFDPQIQSGVLHALTIRTFTPTQWEKQKGR